MSSILFVEPELVIALCKHIIFVNPNDLQIFKDIVLPDDLTKCGLNTTNEKISEYHQDDETSKQENISKEQPTIQRVQISPDHQLLAVTTATQKALLLYKLRPERAQLLSVRPLARVSSALTFSADSKRLLVTDKTGDCYEYDCDNCHAVPKLLFGHLCIVYDILWSRDEKHIITCDRDDKIRVTNYPETYNIHSYCLGHKEFVSGLALLNEDILVSISGDKTMKLWNFKKGEQISSKTLPAPGVKFVVKMLEKEKYEIAVLLHRPNECVVTYILLHTEEKQWTFVSSHVLSFNDMVCHNLCYVHDKLYVVGVINGHFAIRHNQNNSEVSLNWQQIVEDQFKIYSWKPDDVSAWFKKKYDNVSEYLERKKRRIEEKLK